jgi:hypothetical protein
VLPLPLDCLDRLLQQPADSNEVGAAAPHLLTAKGALTDEGVIFAPSASDEAHRCSIRHRPQLVGPQSGADAVTGNS